MNKVDDTGNCLILQNHFMYLPRHVQARLWALNPDPRLLWFTIVQNPIGRDEVVFSELEFMWVDEAFVMQLFAEKDKQPFSWVLAGFWQRSLRRSWVLAVVHTTLK